MAGKQFPSDFRWGTATSSHQVEGDNTNNDWWAFEQQPGRIRNADRSGRACDWWRNAEADFDRMAALNQNAHRLSLEWSRLEPREGYFDDAAAGRYRQMLSGLRARGIEPMVTLNHFTLPLWVARSGGWENTRITEWFVRYARHCAEWFGDLVELWVPINEPNVVLVLGYLQGVFPPAVRNPLRARRALHNLLRSHAAAYRAIHAVRRGARVGTAHNIRLFDPAHKRATTDAWAAGLQSQFFNWVWLDVLHRGEGRSILWSGRMPECANTVDFHGVNYYTRERVRFVPWRIHYAFGRNFYTPGAQMSDYGYGEVYPVGLYRALSEVWRRYARPVFVTENGIPDEDDDMRPRFLLDHLSAVHRAIADGVPVQGYYHWSLLDNFEWAEGWRMKFGLIAMDPVTQERRERPSARLYAEICRTGRLLLDAS
ncbi:MAG: glycoside hydrolase family 1 protein [Armatimonadota bacterium]|nr:glycoside hydrolase family 1 protein [Armatimonadota bacterium]